MVDARTWQDEVVSAATGALLLFGAVQATMMVYGLWRGERFNGWQMIGLALASAGLLMLLLPGLVAPKTTHWLRCQEGPGTPPHAAAFRRHSTCEASGALRITW